MSSDNKDITEQKFSEKNTEFVYLVTHDLRSPIGNILGFTEILLDLPLRNEQEILLTRIRDNGYRALELIRDLQELSSLESGEVPLQLVNCDFSPIAQESLKRVSKLAENKKIQMINKMTESFEIRADREKLKTVLHNLLTNAIKFTSKSGTVSLNAQPDRDGLRIEIEDSGIGIAKEDIPVLFSKKQRIHTAGTEGEEGSGWGLTICQEIMRRHGSEIKVDSILGQGTCCSFVLPWPAKE